MNQKRLKRILESQTAIAKKIYEFVPIQEFWSVRQICTEIHRATQASVDMRIVNGCLNSMQEAGLIKRQGNNDYRRIEITDEHDEAPPEKEAPIMSAPKPVQRTPAPKSVEPDVTIGNLAKRLRDLADEFDEVALEVIRQRDANSELRKRVEGLRALFSDPI